MTLYVLRPSDYLVLNVTYSPGDLPSLQFDFVIDLQKGEVIVDQAHRGYNMADDSAGYRSVNPLFMKYTPTNGKFSGQLGYGYR